MTTTETDEGTDDDDVYPGYYYDGQTGKIVELEQHDGVVDCFRFGEETPLCTYEDASEFYIEDEGFKRVPEFTVNNPGRVAKALYGNGYENTSELRVMGEYLTVPSIEFVDTITEIRVVEEV